MKEGPNTLKYRQESPETGEVKTQGGGRRRVEKRNGRREVCVPGLSTRQGVRKREKK